MLKNLKKTVKHSFIISLGKIGSKLVGFILLPIYTKEIAVSDYGVLGLLELIELVGLQVLAVGLHQALLRWLSLAKEESDKKSIVFTIFICLLLIGSSSVIVVAATREYLSVLLFGNSIYSKLLIYVFLSITFLNLAKISQTILRVEEKTGLYSVSILLQFIASVVLNIWFVAFQKMGVEGVLLAYVISSGLLFLILLPFLISRINFKFDIPILQEMMIFSYPFILTALSATILQMGDRYLLTKLSSLTEVGLYSLGYKFSNVLKIFIIDSFFLGFPIIGWQVVRNNDKPREFFSKIFSYFMFALIWISLFISVYAKGIIHLVALNKDYWDAHTVIPYLLIAVIFLGWAYFLFFILQIPKKTKHISVILTVAAVANIGINFLLIPEYGMMGSAYSRIIANIIAMVLAYVMAQKYYRIEYEFKRLPVLFLLAVTLYLLSGLFDPLALAYRIIFKGLLLLAFPLLLYFLKFYDAEELKNLRKLIFKK
jgi:O-antigen/teichoic acid export membrane protein